jgi:hypothetical protein
MIGCALLDDALVEKMLDAGFWILVPKGNYPYFIQHQATGIQYLPFCFRLVRVRIET